MYVALVAVVFAPVVFTGRTMSPALLQPHGMVDGMPYGYEGRTAEATFNIDLPTAAWYEWPVNRTVARAYLGGEMPLWNPYQAAGTPLAADYSTRAFFPYQVLEDIAPPALADLFLLGRVVVAGILTYLFAASLGLGFPAAVAAGAFYMFSGPFTWFLNLEQFSNVAFVLPGLFLASELLARRRRAREAAFFGVAIALVILGGQPEVAVYALLLAAAFYVLRCAGLWRDGPRPALTALALGCFSLVLGLLLSAPLTLPFLEFVDSGYTLHGPGGGAGLEFVANWRKAVGILTPSATALPASPSFLPGVLEKLGDGSFYRVFATKGSWDYLGGYTGTLAFFLALSGVIGAVSGREPRHRGLIVFFFIAGASIILKNFGVRPFLWLGHLPMFDRAWSPRWAGPTWVFSLSMAAALGLDSLARRLGVSAVAGHVSHEAKGRSLGETAAFVLIAALFALVMAPQAIGMLHAGQSLGLEARAFVFPVVVVGTVVPALLLVAAIALVRLVTEPRRLVWALLLLVVLELWWAVPRGYAPGTLHLKLLPLAAGIAGVVFLAASRRRAAVVCGAVFLLGFIAIDVFAPSGLPHRHDAFAEPPYVGHLRSMHADAGVPDAGLYRVAGGYGVLMPNYAGAAGLADLRHINALLVSGWRDFRYTRLQTPAPTAETFGSSLWLTGMSKQIVMVFDEDRGLYFDTIEQPFEGDLVSHLRWYSVMGVRYILMPSWFGRDGRAELPADMPLVYDGEVRIYENTGAMPRAFVIFSSPDAESLADYADGALRDGVVPARVTEYGYNRVTVEAELPEQERGGGLLVLTDSFYKGWEAAVDGRPADIVLVEGILRGVYLSPGAHTVELRYRPASFRTGAVAFLAGAVIVFASVVPMRRFGYNRGKDTRGMP